MNTLSTSAQLVIVGQAGTPSRRDVSVEFTPPLKQPIPKGEVEAQIVRSNSKGESTVRLADGREVQAKINPPLPKGTELKLRIIAAGKQAKTLKFDLPVATLPRGGEGAEKVQQQAQGQTAATSTSAQATTTQSKAPQIPLDSLKAMLAGIHKAAPASKGAPLTLPSTPVEVRVTGHSRPSTPNSTAQLILTLVSSTNRGTQDFTIQLPEKLPIGTTLTVKPSGNPSTTTGQPVQLNIESISIKPEAVSPTPPQGKEAVKAESAPIAPRSIPAAQTQFTKPLEQLILQRLASENPQPRAEQPATPARAPQQGSVQSQPQSSEGPSIRLYPVPRAPVKVTLTQGNTLQFETPVSLNRGTEVASQPKEAPILKTPAPIPVEGHARINFKPLPNTGTAPQSLPVPDKVILSPAPSAAPQAGSQVAVVQSQMGEGFYSIKLDGRPPLIIQAPSETPLPIGTKLVLANKPDGTTVINQIITPQLSPGAQVQEAMGQKWDSLFKALETLYQKGHDAEGTKLYDSLPRMGDGFIGPFLSFAEAVSKNDISRFVDRDTVNILRALGVDLSADTAQLSMAARSDSSDSGWRSLIFPFLENYGDTPDQGHFFWKREKGGEGKTPTSQFMFRFGLSELGPVHLDGRVDGKTLTLNMKLEKPVDAAFAKGLKELVANVGSGYGLDAVIDVQVLEELPPLPVVATETGGNSQFNMNV